jgi:hypothetical protein
MTRTIWLLSLCWQLPDGDPCRELLMPVLMRRELSPGESANDRERLPAAWRQIRIAPSPR